MKSLTSLPRLTHRLDRIRCGNLPATFQGFEGSDVKAGSYIELDGSGEAPFYELIEWEAQDHCCQEWLHEANHWQDHGCRKDWQGE